MPHVATVRLSSILSALSYALDLTEGHPQGRASRSCLIGMRIAHELKLSAEDRSHLFYALLLKDAACSSNSERVYLLFGGDEQKAKRQAIPLLARFVGVAQAPRFLPARKDSSARQPSYAIAAAAGSIPRWPMRFNLSRLTRPSGMLVRRRCSTKPWRGPDRPSAPSTPTRRA
jgi:hypothetical protein